MARPRTPTNVLDARGAFKKHPERAAEREGEPITNGDIGDPPAHMSDYEQACWHEFVAVAFPSTLCKADRLTVELAACLIAKSRNSPDKFLATERQQLIAIYGRFGMTPSDRSKVSAPKRQAKTRSRRSCERIGHDSVRGKPPSGRGRSARTTQVATVCGNLTGNLT